jgi:hypothetical protein
MRVFYEMDRSFVCWANLEKMDEMRFMVRVKQEFYFTEETVRSKYSRNDLFKFFHFQYFVVVL